MYAGISAIATPHDAYIAMCLVEGRASLGISRLSLLCASEYTREMLADAYLAEVVNRPSTECSCSTFSKVWVPDILQGFARVWSFGRQKIKFGEGPGRRSSFHDLSRLSLATLALERAWVAE